MKAFLMNKRGLKQGFNPWAGKRSAPSFKGNKESISVSNLKKLLQMRQRRKPWGGEANN